MDSTQVIYKRIRDNVPGSETYLPIIEAIFSCLKLRDAPTAEHSIIMAEYSFLLASTHDRINADMYYIGSLTHDIGKLQMDDAILKGDKILTAEERRTLWQHTRYGAELLTKLKMPQLIIDIARYHHERENGSGYPLGLRGKDIPLCGRITAITDTFATLIEGRPYREPKDPDEALWIMKESGHLYDPFILSSFNEILHREHSFH